MAKLQSRIGREGEEAARQYLEGLGYRVLHINWRSGHYELDIVARRSEWLVVVEVKTTDTGFSSPRMR